AGPARNAVKLLRARILGSSPDAVSLYRSVLDDSPQDPDLREALAKLAEVKSVLDEHAEALKLYDQLAAERTKRPRPALDRAGEPPEALAADELRRMGKPDQARKRLLDYIGKGSE